MPALVLRSRMEQDPSKKMRPISTMDQADRQWRRRYERPDGGSILLNERMPRRSASPQDARRRAPRPGQLRRDCPFLRLLGERITDVHRLSSTKLEGPGAVRCRTHNDFGGKDPATQLRGFGAE